MIQTITGSSFPAPYATSITGRRLIGRRVLRYATVGSTQDVAMRLAKCGDSHGTAILSDYQTTGRGRFGRTWISPRGGSTNLSVILRPTPNIIGSVSIAAAVAVVRAVYKLTGLPCTIKWPNDVRIGGRKVCGILVESELPTNGTPLAILGIGLNIDLGDHATLSETATSLARESGLALSDNEISETLLDYLDAVYNLLSGDMYAVWKEWRGLLDTLGRQVQIRWGNTEEHGVANDVDTNGNLILIRSNGSRVSLPAGEVTLQI